MPGQPHIVTVVAALLAAAGPALADPPKIDGALATAEPGGTWRFDVTLSHGDTGWDHYADGWRIETLAGTVLGYRELLHPHVNEQPFTRSLGRVEIGETIGTVIVRARDNVSGWSDEVLELDLPERP